MMRRQGYITPPLFFFSPFFLSPSLLRGIYKKLSAAIRECSFTRSFKVLPTVSLSFFLLFPPPNENESEHCKLLALPYANKNKLISLFSSSYPPLFCFFSPLLLLWYLLCCGAGLTIMAVLGPRFMEEKVSAYMCPPFFPLFPPSSLSQKKSLLRAPINFFNLAPFIVW